MSARKIIVGTNAAVGGPATTATIDSSNNPANSIINNLNVKIQPSSENMLKKQPEEENVEYEAVKYNGMDDVTVVRPKTKTREFTTEDDHDLLVYLVNVFHNIISSDYKSVLNVVDQSGLVILDANSLIGVIARVCSVEESSVRIEIEDEVDVGCCGMVKTKYLPLKPVRKIKVDFGSGYVDFDLTRNDLYNKIQDTYKLSLEKVYENSYVEQLLGHKK